MNSMHLLGDPSLYAYQVKTGVTDLFIKTREYLNLQILVEKRLGAMTVFLNSPA